MKASCFWQKTIIKVKLTIRDVSLETNEYWFDVFGSDISSSFLSSSSFFSA